MESSINERPEWFSAALQAPSRDERIDVDGCEIAYRQWGEPSQPGVVLVHGGRAHRRWWDHVAPLLADQCCVTAVDLSGHGDSGRRASYSWDKWGDEVLAVARAMRGGGEPAVLVAHSMGGRVALKAAATSPTDVSGLILLDVGFGAIRVGGPHPEVRSVPPLRVYESEDDAVKRFRLEPRQPQAMACALEHVARTSVRKVDGGWTWKFDPETRRRANDVGAETVALVTCPVALMRAEHGRVLPEAKRWFEDVLGRPVPMIVVPLAYHSMMFDHPLSLITGVRAFLAQWEHLGEPLH